MGTYTKLLELDKKKPETKKTVKTTVSKKKSPRGKEAQIKKSRYLEINQDRYLDIKKSSFLDFAIPYLDAKPTDQQNFNYPPGAIEELERVVLDLKTRARKQNKRPRWSTTKTTVYILAILFILWDYKENGEDSILHKSIFEKS